MTNKVMALFSKSFLTVVFVMGIVFATQAQKTAPEKYSRIRIYATEKQMKSMQDKGYIYVLGVNRNPDFVDAEVPQKNVESIKNLGYHIEVIVEDMTTHHVAQANLEKAAKGGKVKKAAPKTTPVVNKK